MELEAVGFSRATDRIRVSGPSVPLRSAIVQTLALALHELTTNALKHGALGRKNGTLDITWELHEGPEPHLTLTWREQGLRLSRKQRSLVRRGQGVELIEQALPYTLGAQTSFRLEEPGAVCTIDLPLDALQMEAAGDESFTRSEWVGAKLQKGEAGKLSARNQIKGTIVAVERGATTAHVRIDIGDGVIITSSITNEAVDDLSLKLGDTVFAMTKASDVMVAK
jgi:molybdopterin-binding protein